MAESTVVTKLEWALESALQSLFEDWDIIAEDLEMNSEEVLEHLEWSLSDFDLLTEYRTHIREVWDNE